MINKIKHIMTLVINDLSKSKDELKQGLFNAILAFTIVYVCMQFENITENYMYILGVLGCLIVAHSIFEQYLEYRYYENERDYYQDKCDKYDNLESKEV